MIEKTKTALEAGSCGNRGLGMPGPRELGTRGVRISRSTGSEAGGIVKNCRITNKSDQMCLIKFKRQRR